MFRNGHHEPNCCKAGGNAFSLSFVVILLTGLLATACKPERQAISPTEVFPASSAARTAIVDDFEATSSAWVAGTWPYFSDSSAMSANLSKDHVTRGKQSLQLSFNAGSQPKAIYTLDRELQLGASTTLALDVYNGTGAARAIAIAMRNGDDRQWQESRPITLKPGANAVQFSLSERNFKTAGVNWEYTATVTQTNAVHELALILFPVNAGSVYVDKLIAVRAAPPNQTAAPAHAKSTYVALRAPSTSLAQYDLLELDIDTDQSVDNPFDPDQMAIDLSFTASSGERVNVPAFFYQGFDAATQQPIWPQSWKARFTPTLEGSWSVQATLKTSTETLQSEPIQFEVTPAVSRGFVRVSSENKHYLGFDNGEGYFPVGLNLGWGHADPLQDYRRWLDALQANHADVTRIWMSSWAFGIEWTDSGLGRYKLDKAWQLDQVMQMAQARGINVILVLLNHGAFNIRVNPEWASNPYNAEHGGPCKEPVDFATNADAQKLFQKRLRYIAARWGYATNLLAWEWWNEVDLTPIGELNVLRPWLDVMTPYLRSVDPYHHLVTISYASVTDPRTIDLPEIDVLQHHEYNSTDPRSSIPQAYGRMTSLGTRPATKPSLYTEFGATSSTEQPTRYDSEGLQFHAGLWASTFSGFSNAAMYWWWDSYIEPNQYWYHLKGLSDFLAGENLSRLSVTTTQVNTTTVQAMALAGTDHALVWLSNSQYSVDAAEEDYRQASLFHGVKEADWHFTLQERRNASVTLNAMQDGQYRVEWFDTRDNTKLASATAQAIKGRVTIVAPAFTKDVAAKLTRILAP
jgi:hypothetical protein